MADAAHMSKPLTLSYELVPVTYAEALLQLATLLAQRDRLETAQALIGVLLHDPRTPPAHRRHLQALLDGQTDAQAIAAISRITRGNFRLLERLFPQINRVLKINQLETITDDVVEAAELFHDFLTRKDTP